MKKMIIWVLMLMLSTAVGVAQADEPGGFWNNLFRKVNTIASRSSSQRTYTSVMGIRGAEDVDSDSLYWKGETEASIEADLFISEPEAEKFSNAVSRASEGDFATALAGFTQFIAAYPDSPLVVDAYEAIEKLEFLSADQVPASGIDD